MVEVTHELLAAILAEGSWGRSSPGRGSIQAIETVPSESPSDLLT